jgi:hypothetical protein
MKRLKTKAKNWFYNFLSDHPLFGWFVFTALGGALIYSAGYAEARYDNVWITLGGIGGIIIGLELIQTGINALDDNL